MIPTGIYHHYKGNTYQVLGVAMHSETEEEFVVYRALYGNRGLWVRPLKMFQGKVEVKEESIPRFELIQKEDEEANTGQ